MYPLPSERATQAGVQSKSGDPLWGYVQARTAPVLLSSLLFNRGCVFMVSLAGVTQD